MRYYDLNNGFFVCYNTIPHFECENIKEHPAKGYYKRGEIVRKKVSEVAKEIDSNTVEITTVFRNTRIYKGVKVDCPYCDGNIKYLGWRVTVEDHRKEKITAGMFSSGTKYPYSKYCKTLKNRKATIDRLIKKYSN